MPISPGKVYNKPRGYTKHYNKTHSLFLKFELTQMTDQGIQCHWRKKKLKNVCCLPDMVGVASCAHWCKVWEPSMGLTICNLSGSLQDPLPIRPLLLPLKTPVDIILSGVRIPNGRLLIGELRPPVIKFIQQTPLFKWT